MRVHPLLHFTRRGPTLCFRDADTGAAAGGAAAAAAAPPDPNAEAAAPVDYKALLLALLSLPDDATDEQISAKETEIRGTLGGVGDLETKASKADELQKQYDDLQAQYEDLNKKQQEIWKQKQEAEADEILAVYKDRFVDEAAMAPIRNILLSDKEAGIAILNGLKKPDAAPAGEATTRQLKAGAAKRRSTIRPRRPIRNAGRRKATEEEKATKISARAKEIVAKSKPKISLTKAYQQAEAELYPPQ
jgi:hypothetical protein